MSDKRNHEWYPDPTAYRAIKNMEEEEKFHRLLSTILYICNLAGFKVEGRIVLRDRKTGRIWK